MDTIRIKYQDESGYTLIPDSFVDRYLPEADGNHVKIYLYLLRNARADGFSMPLSSAADVFCCEEADITDALRYWEDAGLLSVAWNQGQPVSVTLYPLGRHSEAFSSGDSGSDERPSGIPLQIHDGIDGSGQLSFSAVQSSFSPAEPPAVPAQPSPAPAQLSRDRSRQLLSDQEEVRQIVFIAEQYLKRTLSSADIGRLLYLYDELGFSVDLIDYLVEHCVSLGKHSMHYIEKVGLEWYNDGIREVSDAKERTAGWGREYYAILRAFGISGRSPVAYETTYMDRWLRQYSFSIDLIREACTRTIRAKGKASFDYAEGILSSWHREGIRTPEDVRERDARHAEQQKQTQKKQTQNSSAGTRKRSGAENRFNNFHQRDYDYSELEKQLLAGSRNSGKEQQDS